jgi:hypothetical protein
MREMKAIVLLKGMRDMKLLGFGALAAICGAASAGQANAACRFSPFEFFPDRNDHVQIQVTTDSASVCGIAFREGPGYKFTSASFLKAPPHGVLAKTGFTKFTYIPFKGYHGSDSFAIKVCAIVQGRKGCSSLTYVVEVR